METIEPRGPNDTPLAILARCGGYYDCPLDVNGKALGPLVGYAGKYNDNGVQKQFVGHTYANFAKAERHGPVIDHFAQQLTELIIRHEELLPAESTGFCGAPEGGKKLSTALEIAMHRQGIFPEKQEKGGELKWGRHRPEPDELWWIVEDVCNNFSTTVRMASLIEEAGASVAGVVCILNRSLIYSDYYQLPNGARLPILYLVRKKIQEYQQGEALVADDVANGNVIFDPKPNENWSALMEAMEKYPTKK